MWIKCYEFHKLEIALKYAYKFTEYYIVVYTNALLNKQFAFEKTW